MHNRTLPFFAVAVVLGALLIWLLADRATHSVEEPKETKIEQPTPQESGSRKPESPLTPVVIEPNLAPSFALPERPSPPRKSVESKPTPKKVSRTTLNFSRGGPLGDAQETMKAIQERNQRKEAFADALSLFELTSSERDTLADLLEDRAARNKQGATKQRGETEEALIAFLGTEGYQRLKDHESAAESRSHVKSLERTLGDGLALSRDQRGQLQSLFGELDAFNRTQREEIGRDGIDKRLDELATRYTKLAQRADRVLGAEQSALLVDHLQTHLAYVETQEKAMAELRASLSGDAKVSFQTGDTPFSGTARLTGGSISIISKKTE